MKTLLSMLFLVFLSGNLSFGQSKEQIRHELDSIYLSNISKSRINGVYIPKDMDDAFVQLDKLSTDEARAKYKATSEEIVAKKLHFGLGRWMSYNWNFDEGSRFSHLLRKMGIANTDDMIDFMLISYHRHLNAVDQGYGDRIKIYQEKAKKAREEELKKGEVIHTEVRPIPKKD